MLFYGGVRPYLTHRIKNVFFDNKVKRKVFGSKRDNVTKDVQKLHDEQVHDLYSLASIMLVMK